MLDTYGKYLRLISLIVISFLGLIGLFVLLLFSMKWFFRLLDTASITSSIYLFFMLLIPAAIFCSIYVLFFKRTKSHPSKSIRGISNIVFLTGILSWLISVVFDMITFFKTGNVDTTYYMSFDKWILIPNGAAIFIVSILQAFFTKKK